MTPSRGQSVFLERKNYRQRRLRDVIRVLPIVGVALWLVPVLWSSDPAAPVRNSFALQYLFCVWLVLIMAAWALSRRMKPDQSIPTPEQPD